MFTHDSLSVEITERGRGQWVHPWWKIVLRKFCGRGISTFIDYSIVVIQVSHESIDTLLTALFIDKKIPHGNHIFYQALVGPTCSRRLEIRDRSLHATIV